MAVSLQTQIDKSAWGEGPWRIEPDRVEFEHAGLPCLLARGPGGHWCGYAAVPPSHPWHGKDYNSVPVDVHGGLTYGAPCDGSHICHVPKPGEPDDVFWFGFDCAHAGDYAPKFGVKYPWPDRAYDHNEQLRKFASGEWLAEIYRDVAYVRAETERLAEQLAAVQR